MPLLRRISNATEFSMMLYCLDCACINEAGLGDDDDPGMIPRRTLNWGRSGGRKVDKKSNQARSRQTPMLVMPMT